MMQLEASSLEDDPSFSASMSHLPVPPEEESSRTLNSRGLVLLGLRGEILRDLERLKGT